MFATERTGQNGSPPPESCFKNNRLQVTLSIVGSILVALGIVLSCLSQYGTALGAIGGVVTALGVPLLSYGVLMLIFTKCAKNVEPNSNSPEVEQQGRTQGGFSAIPPNGTSIPIPKPLSAGPKDRVFMSFGQKMFYLYPEYRKAHKKDLSTTCENLSFSELEGKEAIRGDDSEGKAYFAIHVPGPAKEEEIKERIWVFKENSTTETIFYVKINKQRSLGILGAKKMEDLKKTLEELKL